MHVVMITGDSKDTAVAIASNLGLLQGSCQAALGPQDIDTLSVTELSRRLQNVAVFYRVAPKHKVKIINAFRQQQEVVAMTGDGVNDAPALRQAHIGIAMGKNGTDVAREAAAMVLMDDNFVTITKAIDEGKAIFANVRNFVRFQLTTSMASLSIIALATLQGMPLPFNPIQILFVNIIMDGPPAQSLGVEPLDPVDRLAPPRRPDTPVLSRSLLTGVLLGAITMLVGTMSIFVFIQDDALEDKVGSSSTPAILSNYQMTAAFSTFVFFQIFNSLNCRSLHRSIFKIPFFQNKFVVTSAVACFTGQLLFIYFGPLQKFFDTVPLSFPDLMVCIFVAMLVIIVDELRKLIFGGQPVGDSHRNRYGSSVSRLSPRE